MTPTPQKWPKMAKNGNLRVIPVNGHFSQTCQKMTRFRSKMTNLMSPRHASKINRNRSQTDKNPSQITFDFNSNRNSDAIKISRSHDTSHLSKRQKSDKICENPTPLDTPHDTHPKCCETLIFVKIGHTSNPWFLLKVHYCKSKSWVSYYICKALKIAGTRNNRVN